MTTILDPMQAAVADAENANQLFGKIEVDAQFVILRKGERKRVWTEGESIDGRQTEVTFRLNPLDCSGLTRMVERQIISNSREWSGIVWASLRDLGVKSLHEVRGKWAKVNMVESGRSWTNREGETVKGTTFKFIELYDTEAACIAAWEQQFGGSGSTEAHTPGSNGNGNGSAPEPVNDAEKAVAAQFLPALVKGANGDLTVLANVLAQMSPVNKYFTVDSPEVQELLGSA